MAIVDKSEDPGLQVLSAGEGTLLEELVYQDAQPDFDLVEPRAMLRSVMKHHLATGMREKSSATAHRQGLTVLRLVRVLRSRSCRRLASAALDRRVLVWDTHTG
jgi:hypothetical protein